MKQTKEQLIAEVVARLSQLNQQLVELERRLNDLETKIKKHPNL